MNWTEARDRLQGCYITIPTMFRDDADLSVDHDAIAAARPVPDRRRRDDRQRGAPGGRRGGRLLDDDVRRAGRRLAGGGRGGRTAGSRSRSAARRPQHARARRGSSAPRKRSGPTTSRSRRRSTTRTRRATSSTTSSLGADAADIGFIVYNTYWTSLGPLERARREARRRAERRQPQVVHARHRDDDLRGHRRPGSRSGSRSSTTRCAT